ncbi:MAG: hypothetical protein ACRER7_02210 [Gammaproteobacteria bacterium]
MYKHTSRLIGFAILLIAGFALCQPAMAVRGISAGQSIKGTVQQIDYLHHAITVNGQTYAVAPNASFQGVAGFTVLHVGMPIQYTLGYGSASQESGPGAMPPGPAPGDELKNPATPASDSPQVIVSITWLPGGI